MDNSLETAILTVIQSNPGVITLREIIAGFYQFHYSEVEIRKAVIALERNGQIEPNWNWRFAIPKATKEKTA